ncbi:WecB/TagA/CpsF family glycosyltransferase [Planococcus salinus]|uniref:Glycosyltransferase n=1 Tax=Planococcus salinus TaxID=1848460 RepID=A0A3M8P8G0_9BACL|nr:WecB/TagA/CpsF family glycosyltransferase [Planococcus salinus]RNF39484.1 glycosyltransferase [Planococcus salinus]
MSKGRVTIVDIPIDNLFKSQLVSAVYTRLEKQQKNTFIVTANPEIIMAAKRNDSYQQAILQADYIIPDGTGVMLASTILSQPLAEKIVGYELLHTFLSYAGKQQKSVYFFGSKKGVAEQAAANAETLYPGLVIAGVKDGYSGIGQETVEEIAACQPDFLFVGLGVPLQELWIAQHRHLFPCSVLMGVGGSFDVLSGKTKRAPKFWLDWNLEWLYRLITQPTRGVRMIQLPIFVVEVHKQKWRERRYLAK